MYADAILGSMYADTILGPLRFFAPDNGVPVALQHLGAFQMGHHFLLVHDTGVQRTYQDV